LLYLATASSVTVYLWRVQNRFGSELLITSELASWPQPKVLLWNTLRCRQHWPRKLCTIWCNVLSATGATATVKCLAYNIPIPVQPFPVHLCAETDKDKGCKKLADHQHC